MEQLPLSWIGTIINIYVIYEHMHTYFLFGSFFAYMLNFAWAEKTDMPICVQSP